LKQRIGTPFPLSRRCRNLKVIAPAKSAGVALTVEIARIMVASCAAVADSKTDCPQNLANLSRFGQIVYAD
jgi:hypothetical protein